MLRIERLHKNNPLQRPCTDSSYIFMPLSSASLQHQTCAVLFSVLTSTWKHLFLPSYLFLSCLLPSFSHALLCHLTHPPLRLCFSSSVLSHHLLIALCLFDVSASHHIVNTDTIPVETTHGAPAGVIISRLSINSLSIVLICADPTHLTWSESSLHTGQMASLSQGHTTGNATITLDAYWSCSPVSSAGTGSQGSWWSGQALCISVQPAASPNHPPWCLKQRQTNQNRSLHSTCAVTMARTFKCQPLKSCQFKHLLWKNK